MTDSNTSGSEEEEPQSVKGTNSELATLKRKRASAQGSITRIKNLVQDSGASLNPYELETRLGLLETYFVRAVELHNRIEGIDSDEKANTAKLCELEEAYCSTKSAILAYTRAKEGAAGSMATQTSFCIPSIRHRNLPQLKLPFFTGKYTEFLDFWNKFKTLVDNDSELDDAEKFQHLLNCLGEEVKATVDKLEPTSDNYKKAKDMLEKRYHNNCIILGAHIRELFELPAALQNSVSSLRKLLDSVNSHLQSMSSIATDTDIYNGLILYLVLSKVDTSTQIKWDDFKKLKDYPKWEEFSEFLNSRCQILENRELTNKASPTTFALRSSSSKPKHNFNNRNKSTVLTSVAQNTCICCRSSEHNIVKCSKFLSKTPINRFYEVKRLSLCLNCLGKGHSTINCSSPRCSTCEGAHHALLHRDQPKALSHQGSSKLSDYSGPVNHVSARASASGPQPGTSAGSSLVTSFLSSEPSNRSSAHGLHTFLATAIVYIEDKWGSFTPCRAVLDSASQLNFLCEPLLKKLNLKRFRIREEIHGIGDISSKVNYKTNVTIKSRCANYVTNLEMWVLQSIADSQPESIIEIDDWKIPKNIQLADPQFNCPGKIDILIGASVFFELLCVGQIKLKENLPILQKTLLGWVVAGQCSFSGNHQGLCSMVAMNSHSPEEGLLKILERFWNIESIQSPPLIWTQEQQDSEAHFRESCKRTTEGRFIVRYPLKDSPSVLGNSYEIATRRFLYLEKKLDKNPELKGQYVAFLREYRELKHMEAIPAEGAHSVRYYVPHHCIVRPESSTTKLRVVFDCSCPTSSNISLNEIMMIGPPLQQELFDILIRFRSHKYVLTGDISKMYRQILVDDEDKRLQCILWREDSAETLQTFQLNTVTYGTAAAPFLATRCLKQLADEYVGTHPMGANIIYRDFYMDDVITGADSIDELIKIRTELCEILKKGQFELRKWCANEDSILEGIPLSDREQTLKFNDSDIVKTLGLVWHPKDDKMCIRYSADTVSRKITKRTVLSETARIFDPLGLINPVTVLAKIFLQDLWKLKLDWDESLPMKYLYQWERIAGQLNKIIHIEIPRFVLVNTAILKVELHGFSDASQRAYGCCIYFRSINNTGEIVVSLLCAKSRVAPVKTITLPRLELCASELLAHLINRVKKNIDRSIDEIYCWTDSEIVLDWLAGHPSDWPSFVAHRVAKIQDVSTIIKWRHVPTKSNPADIVSRGMLPEALMQSTLWFSGPTFLHQLQSEWPTRKRTPPHNCLNEKLPESKVNAKVMLTVNARVEPITDLIRTHMQINSFRRLQRIFAYVLRFAAIIRRRPKEPETHRTEEFSAEELDSSLKAIIWNIQRKEFAPEILALEKQKEVNNKSCLKSLSPFLQTDSALNLLRVGGRLHKADTSYPTKHPIILPKNHPFTKTLLNHLHLINCHAGPQALVGILRQRFWVSNARSLARQIVRRCIRCFHFKPHKIQQLMGILPPERVQPARPFVNSAVDFCGPVWTHFRIRGKRPEKTYIAVFCCFATKAVHLECVSDLTADGFIGALKRFVARRGRCRKLFCDNATNFVGARNQLAELHEVFNKQPIKDYIIRMCAQDGIDFHHVPPRTPHFNGLVEAAVKSMKHLLYRTLAEASLTFEELTTLVAQIEAILNSRPLTPLSSDPADFDVLTPGHFLVGEPLTSIVEPDARELKIELLRRWQRLRVLQQTLWTRWRKEYLTNLQNRLKWSSASPNIRKDTMVFVADEDLPPQRWLLGRIERVHPGPDGHVRVVDVRTKVGLIRRSIHKVCPLPIEDPSC